LPPAPTITSSSRSRCRNCWRGCGPAAPRQPRTLATILTYGDIELDREKAPRRALGPPVDLGPTEYRLLEFFLEHPGRVFSREQLLDSVWGRDIYIDERTVDVHIGRLRKLLNRGREQDPIRTVRGAGYALDDRFAKVE
jgi:two-component system phosphate regulon response regulator PhoB